VSMSKRVKIDDIEVYEEDLTETGKALLKKIKATDMKLTELQDERSILQTAKNAYEGMVRDTLLKLKEKN
jgi:hypothetical protein